MSRLSEQLRHSASSSQGLEHKLQIQETEYRHLEQQLKREIDQLKQQQMKLNKELTKKTQERTRRSPRHTRGECGDNILYIYILYTVDRCCCYGDYHGNHHIGGHSGQDEDTEMRIVTLQSVNSHLNEENKRHIREFQVNRASSNVVWLV